MNTQERDRSLRWTILGACVLMAILASMAVAALAAGDGNQSWRRAIAFSTAVCGSGALAGWLIARLPYRSPVMGVAGGLGAVLARIAVPLGGLAWLQGGGSHFCGPGADRLLAVFYLALLATDVILHIIGSLRSHRRGNHSAVH